MDMKMSRLDNLDIDIPYIYFQNMEILKDQRNSILRNILKHFQL